MTDPVLAAMLADPDDWPQSAGQSHEPTHMVWYRRGNQKHRHNTRKGVRNCNHWFNVYRCPVCGRTASHRRLPIVCRGADPKQ